ncbi:hypothetical protein J2T14_005187 [Paenibacillus harenae]|nr:hypothetical protein [Paenibacillus harenae]
MHNKYTDLMINLLLVHMRNCWKSSDKDPFVSNILMNRIAGLLFENMALLLSIIVTSLKSIQFYCKICILSNKLLRIVRRPYFSELKQLFWVNSLLL